MTFSADGFSMLVVAYVIAVIFITIRLLIKDIGLLETEAYALLILLLTLMIGVQLNIFTYDHFYPSVFHDSTLTEIGFSLGMGIPVILFALVVGIIFLHKASEKPDNYLINNIIKKKIYIKQPCSIWAAFLEFSILGLSVLSITPMVLMEIVWFPNVYGPASTIYIFPIIMEIIIVLFLQRIFVTIILHKARKKGTLQELPKVPKETGKGNNSK